MTPQTPLTTSGIIDTKCAHGDYNKPNTQPGELNKNV